MPLKRSSEIKVGLFALAALSAFLISIVVLTSKSGLFRRTITLHTQFKDIAGMIDGSEVRLSGVAVGFVTELRFSRIPGDATVYIDFTLDDRGMERVTKDSRATIGSLGLLGKKYLEIMPGNIQAGLVQSGDTLESVEPASMAEALDKAGKILDNINDTAQYLKKLFASIAGEEGAKTDLADTITSIRHIVGEVETGQGVLHDLIYEPTKAQILTDLQATVHRISEVVARIEEGPGNIHEAVYGEQVKTLMDNLAATSDALRQVISDIKTEKGIMHGLIYDPEQAKMLEDLRRSAANLAEISQRIERGEGTIGGLLIDPTIYEDLKKLTGEVERNRVLKTYIRYVVRKREADREKAEQPPPAPAPEETPQPAAPKLDGDF
jgi:phospholipid/cholesterol/gamma-HCH transport system substrate-binding protein